MNHETAGVLLCVLAPIAVSAYFWLQLGYFNGRWARLARKEHADS